MIVILEGPDGAGKTTLAQEIAAIIDGRLHHEGPPQTDKLLQYYANLLDTAYRSKEDVVFDRLHLGEAVYGPIVRGRSLINDLGLGLLSKQIRTMDAVVVSCMPPFLSAFTNWKVRHQSEYVQNDEAYRKIYTAYNALFMRYGSTYHWDYTHGDLPDLLAKIFNRPPVPFRPGYLGPLNPEVVFVGESANHPYLDLPFFAQENSSAYLYECLKNAGWDFWEYGMINAMRPRSILRDDLAKILHDLNPKYLVALGGAAQRSLKRAGVRGIQEFSIPHPAYWKRFHSRKTDEYVARLREIRDRIHPKPAGVGSL